jgi:hypothetical protein
MFNTNRYNSSKMSFEITLFPDDALFLSTSVDEMYQCSKEISDMYSVPMALNDKKSDLCIIFEILNYLSSNHPNVKSIIIR